jgi:hypothetical protein
MQQSLERSVLKALAYFDVFHYPLLQEEIHYFMDQELSLQDLQPVLEQLIAARCVYRLGDFYSLRNDRSLVTRRLNGNRKATTMLVTAYKVAALLYRFPFVRGVGISGSLSKNYADDQTDFDFFIVTSADRLWIARTLMHLFKKLTYLVGKQHWFCMNYYVDEAALSIEERNVFTAVELLTLVPVSGNDTMHHFFKANDWAMHYFPNAHRRKDPQRLVGCPWYKKLAEWCFNHRLGNWLDDYLMRLTSRRWKQKEDAYKVNMKGNRMGLQTGKHFSRPNPVHFQKRVLETYRQKITAVEEIWMVCSN